MEQGFGLRKERQSQLVRYQAAVQGLRKGGCRIFQAVKGTEMDQKGFSIAMWNVRFISMHYLLIMATIFIICVSSGSIYSWEFGA